MKNAPLEKMHVPLLSERRRAWNLDRENTRRMPFTEYHCRCGFERRRRILVCTDICPIYACQEKKKTSIRAGRKFHIHFLSSNKS
jgi:hypothetical protein